MALTPETGLHTFMDISKNWNFAKDYYIIVHQWQEERIWTDNNWSYISYYSYVKWFYTDKPDNFDTLPKCSGYPIERQLIQTGSVQQIEATSPSEKFLETFSSLQCVLLWVTFWCLFWVVLYKVFSRKK